MRLRKVNLVIGGKYNTHIGYMDYNGDIGRISIPDGIDFRIFIDMFFDGTLQEYVKELLEANNL